jgi:hypothetical protein
MNRFPARREQAARQRPLLRTAQLRIAMEDSDMSDDENHCNCKERPCLQQID